MTTATTKVTGPGSSADEQPAEVSGSEAILTLEFSLGEADALRAWLLKSVVDGATPFDEPFVNSALGNLARAVDAATATANIRHELEQMGLDVAHLTDEQVREVGRRVSDAATPAIRG
jgi:hypothetical protein